MKKKLSVSILLCLILCSGFSLWACASAPEKLLGSVRIYGSEPHTYASILSEADDKVYLIDDPEKEQELRDLQGRRVEFTVKLISTSPGYPPADGKVSVISYRIME